MARKILGILGGMGPEATVDFMEKIIKATPATDDYDHIHMLVDNNPQIPSRVEAILGSGESPAPVLIKMARNLEKWGADFLAIPCNTAHFYYDDVKNAVNIPVLNMIKITRDRVLREISNIKKVGLLASTAVIITKLYHNIFNEDNIEIIIPEDNMQKRVMGIIFAVKANKCTEKEVQDFQEIINHLRHKGVEAIIIACTELSVLLKEIKCNNIPIFDAAQIMAEEVVHIVKE